MAEQGGMFPLTTRQFSTTFLDFQPNSRGYNGKVESADQDVMKRLLNPFLPDFEVFSISQRSQCDRFGKAMWTFAKERTALHRQSANRNTDLNPPDSHFNLEGDLEVTPTRADELPRSSELPLVASKNELTPTSCKLPEFVDEKELCSGPLKSDFTQPAASNEALKSKTTSNGTDKNQNTVNSQFITSQKVNCQLPDCLQQQSSDSCEELHNEAHVNNKLNATEVVPNFEYYIELANLDPGTMLSTDCHLQNSYEKRADIAGDLESKHYSLFSGDEKRIKNEEHVKTEESTTSRPSVDDIENKDATDGQHLCDVSVTERKKALKESLQKEHQLIPLPLYKKGNHSNIPISTSLTVDLNLEAVLSVLRSEKNIAKYAKHDNGSIYGKVAILYGFQQNARVSVLRAEIVGLYDYISGTVNGLQEGFCQDDSKSQVKTIPCIKSNKWQMFLLQARMELCPGMIPARCHMWLEFVVGSCLAPKVFCRVLWFSSLHKNQHLQI